MLEQLGHPEKDLRIIHIAGTNGKGSVSAFLRSVFECAGSKTGMFTSPHLVDFRERIRINGAGRYDLKRGYHAPWKQASLYGFWRVSDNV